MQWWYLDFEVFQDFGVGLLREVAGVCCCLLLCCQPIAGTIPSRISVANSRNVGGTKTTSNLVCYKCGLEYETALKSSLKESRAG